MSPVFPELSEQKELITKVLRSEENAFNKTLSRGLQLFEKLAEKSESISGENAFTLYDTYGFPLDLTEILAQERGLTVDTAGFEAEMEKQRSRSRAAQTSEVIEVAQEGEGEKTEFDGYTSETLVGFAATVVDAQTLEKEAILVLDKTPFYAEMGGQIGDTGIVEWAGGSAKIIDTQKDASGKFLHKLPADATLPEVGTIVALTVDTERRQNIARHHTATHLLQSALKNQLGTHIQQAGSLVTDSVVCVLISLTLKE